MYVHCTYEGTLNIFLALTGSFKPCSNSLAHFVTSHLCVEGDTPENEIQIYTWLDASLKELTGLIKEVNPDARRSVKSIC